MNTATQPAPAAPLQGEILDFSGKLCLIFDQLAAGGALAADVTLLDADDLISVSEICEDPTPDTWLAVIEQLRPSLRSDLVRVFTDPNQQRILREKLFRRAEECGLRIEARGA
jgi:hypothetical protein